MKTALPVIELTPFLGPSTRESKLTCAASLAAACKNHGFFYLRSPLPPALESRALSLARGFFLDTPLAAKNALARTPADPARGYQCLNENHHSGTTPDHHEAVDFYRPAPTNHTAGLFSGPNLWPVDPEHRAVFDELWGRLETVGQAAVTAMAWALGYEDEPAVIGRNMHDSFWAARWIGYPPLPPGSAGFSCGEHTDYGGVTFLLMDDTPGALEVENSDGRWVKVNPLEGAYVVNIGDMVERWTNGMWKSTKHRVVHAGEGYRVSLPFFYDPDWDAVVGPLEKCIMATGGLRRYEDVVYGEHLRERVHGTLGDV